MTPIVQIGDMLSNIINTGVISSGNNGGTYIVGSTNYSLSGSVTNNIVQEWPDDRWREQFP